MSGNPEKVTPDTKYTEAQIRAAQEEAVMSTKKELQRRTRKILVNIAWIVLWVILCYCGIMDSSEAIWPDFAVAMNVLLLIILCIFPTIRLFVNYKAYSSAQSKLSLIQNLTPLAYRYYYM